MRLARAGEARGAARPAVGGHVDVDVGQRLRELADEAPEEVFARAAGPAVEQPELRRAGLAREPASDEERDGLALGVLVIERHIDRRALVPRFDRISGLLWARTPGDRLDDAAVRVASSPRRASPEEVVVPELSPPPQPAARAETIKAIAETSL